MLNCTVDWGKLPTWAKYAAMDIDGEWYCFEALPVYKAAQGAWQAPRGTRFKEIATINTQHSLQERPNNG